MLDQVLRSEGEKDPGTAAGPGQKDLNKLERKGGVENHTEEKI